MAVKGRDVSAPQRHITLDGQTYGLVFNNYAARLAEDIYEEQYGRDEGYAVILQELSRLKHRALMAVVYGAMIAGGAEMTWEEFDEKFKYGALAELTESIRSAVLESLPQGDNEKKTDEKN